ncbi:MAG: sulfatase-like hydrolase/transferase, partial [Rhodospirillaceae bacterium]|nr:sulfatase-like hydrolase/transferase [Rhodospirillaceae bacterium]
MSGKRNVLWIMADQLRFDYLSCAGHPTLDTPHLDALAARGVRFDRAYVQSPFCGPSRASYYTGRYCRSHGATWNGFPVRVGEPSLGDHLRDLDVRCALVGKTHMVPDREGMARFGIDPDSPAGRSIAECGFEPFERDDGLHPFASVDKAPDYNEYLRRHGFEADNPWEEWANSGEGPDGEILSGWLLKNSGLPARIPAEHSETAYMTNRAMEFMAEAEAREPDRAWLLHLSFIKPHWPYIAPAPYHALYSADDILPAVRSNAERQTDHPLYRAYQDSRICQTMARDDVRRAVIPAYMGLVKQIDDELGRLFAWMAEKGLMDNTMIVFCSDHGDYLGDHWMGEKDLFHEPSIRTPLILYDPRPEADATRSSASSALVEGIDLVPTFLEYFGGPELPHILEGRSLSPLLYGSDSGWRQYAFAEYDYATRPARVALGEHANDSRLVMVCDARWKFVWCKEHRPILFDLENDPKELVDLGGDPDHAEVRARMTDAILEWATRFHARTTKTHAELDRIAGGEPRNILIGIWDEADYEAAFGH